MTASRLFSFHDANNDSGALESAISMAEGVARTICIARALVEKGRTVDMAGLEHGVDILCAKALDLPLDAGRMLRPTLIMVLEEAENLTETLYSQAA